MTDPVGSVMKKWLTEIEYVHYQQLQEYIKNSAVPLPSVKLPMLQQINTYENLAACRALLDELQWCEDLDDAEIRCPKCWARKLDGHKLDCAIATALKGVGGE